MNIYGVRLTYTNGACGTLCTGSKRYGTRDKWSAPHARKLARELRALNRADIRPGSIRVVRFGGAA